ncbi:Uncharacterised protein [Mycolicibacterium vanbaalenii]|uniref:Uncharacterized protein n=1 Tax=Mycolicibacterium vanbaalenii TaxID=110539 RepID=A0A5S9R9I0_MYCVN|nr:hypothetical protein [Mycolicibacterium vanbaalenii]CAA0136356.1 Uncharacterised protein [Mycolicibacterium vanbaalenii]
MSDVVERAKAALEEFESARAADHAVQEPICDTAAAGMELAAVVPELVAEVERLRGVLIDRVVADHRAERGVRPVPVEGRVWLYRSSVDGAEVLVRWELDGWETADPGLPSRWYTQDSSLLEWPGRFTELESGFPR